MRNKEIEVEFKIPIPNKPEKLIVQLNTLTQKETTDEYQKDVYYTPPHKDYFENAPKVPEWLRLRYSRKGNCITYKNFLFKGDENLNACDEYETEITDMSAMEKIFTALDIKELITVEKMRNTWVYKEVEIVVDEVTDLGWFVELESKGDFETIEEAKDHLTLIAQELNIDVNQRDETGYPYMLMKKKWFI